MVTLDRNTPNQNKPKTAQKVHPQISRLQSMKEIQSMMQKNLFWEQIVVAEISKVYL